MKRIVTICLFCFFLASLTAQIEYTDFGPNGLVIELNENYAMDINDDGFTDFYINGELNEIGFVPIWGVGCFTSESSSAVTSFGSRELQLHESDEFIHLDGANMIDYIDDDRGSIWTTGNQFAANWENGSEHFIGFAVFAPGETFDGWMSVELNTENQTMIIHDMAYKPQSNGDGGINAGEGRLSSINDLHKVLASVNIGPSPARHILNVSFDYSSDEALRLELISMDGKRVYQHPFEMSFGNQQIQIGLDEFAAGNYMLRLSSAAGVFSKKILIAK